MKKIGKRMTLKDEMIENSSVQEEDSNRGTKSGFYSKQSRRESPQIKESQVLSRFSEKFREMFNKDELLEEVNDMIRKKLDESEEELYNSIQDLNDTLTQLIKDSVNDVLTSLKIEMQEDMKNIQENIKLEHNETAISFEKQHKEKERLENKLP